MNFLALNLIVTLGRNLQIIVPADTPLRTQQDNQEHAWKFSSLCEQDNTDSATLDREAATTPSENENIHIQRNGHIQRVSRSLSTGPATNQTHAHPNSSAIPTQIPFGCNWTAITNGDDDVADSRALNFTQSVHCSGAGLSIFPDIPATAVYVCV